jgi:hypothetical protein
MAKKPTPPQRVDRSNQQSQALLMRVIWLIEEHVRPGRRPPPSASGVASRKIAH